VQSTINSSEPSILQNTQVSLQQATKLNLQLALFSLSLLHFFLKHNSKVRNKTTRLSLGSKRDEKSKTASENYPQSQSTKLKANAIGPMLISITIIILCTKWYQTCNLQLQKTKQNYLTQKHTKTIQLIP
jgi:uncharacterized ion transporter superfamily protein YfcC